MSIFNPPTGESPLDREVAHVRGLLLGVTDALSALSDKLRHGDVKVSADTGKVLAELRHTIRMAIDTENRFEDRRKQQEGVAHSYKLELETARSSIGRRLARLRAANSS